MSHFGRTGPPDIKDTYSLLVLNISFRTNADDLFPLFDRYGKVVDVFIPRDRRTGESRGFAFVRYKYADEAQMAVERLDGKFPPWREVDGRNIMVQFAKYGPNAERIHKGKIMEAIPSRRGRSRSRSPRPRQVVSEQLNTLYDYLADIETAIEIENIEGEAAVEAEIGMREIGIVTVRERIAAEVEAEAEAEVLVEVLTIIGAVAEIAVGAGVLLMTVLHQLGVVLILQGVHHPVALLPQALRKGAMAESHPLQKVSLLQVAVQILEAHLLTAQMRIDGCLGVEELV
ncbi:hypothetical protein ZIOFF_022643 [Zingiber officinale]|uniref:RRM domain-containing protein n=1 Tax=Zingiber officinale TaxID=94328 RepID=A0A8J5LMW8_ZINOF|nr:hypothetical protein ZIOFF_022643 [Zingiber officinale]